MNELDESVPIWVGLCDEFGNEFPTEIGYQRAKLIRGNIIFPMEGLEYEITVCYFRFFDAPEGGRSSRPFLINPEVLEPEDVAMFAYGDIMVSKEDFL